MKTIPQQDIIRKADGTATTVVVEPAKKFSLTAVNDKMGVTTAGSVAKGFIWGAIIGAVVVHFFGAKIAAYLKK
jgi:hypothetical protein